MNRHFKTIASIFLLVTVFNLNGCISLLPSPGLGPNLVSLSSHETSKIASTKVLLVDEPTCPIMFDATKIVIQKTNPTGLPYFTHAQGQEWSERLPAMLQRILVNHFKSPKWPGVITDVKTVGADYRLMTDIIKFQIVSPGAVEVSMNITLVESKGRKILVTKTFDYKIISDDRATSYLRAFEKAVTQFLTDCDGLLAGFLKN
jgi:ABC-type uncharacterized transport system auxiliary subunit